MSSSSDDCTSRKKNDGACSGTEDCSSAEILRSISASVTNSDSPSPSDTTIEPVGAPGR
jgi:hypothetical protein